MEFGKRLLPQVVDHHARTDPGRIYASIPRSTTDLKQGFQDVTMVSLAAMVNRIARWLEQSIGVGGLDTLAYIGPADIRYAVVFLGAVKAGYKALFISPRNQPSQNESMLRRSGCKAFFYAQEMAVVATSLGQAVPDLVVMSIPALSELLDTPLDTEHYAYDKTFEQARDEPCLVLHSSGSTGDPKLVTMTHGTFSVTDNDRNMPVPEGRAMQNAAQFNFEGGAKFYSCFPPYHLAGVHAYIDLPIFASSATVVFGPTDLPPSGYLLSEILKTQDVRAFYVPPFIIEQWSVEPAADEQARKLKFILYGGGPLSPHIGDKLNKVTRVCQMYGSLEVGQVQLLVPRPGQWSYMELNPYEECDMQPVGDGSFEMVLHQDPKSAAHRSLWHNFPQVESWRTGDLFVPHASEPGLWRFHSRIDDLIVLSSSHKVRPLEMETIIQGDPLLSGALIAGQGKPEPLLLVEAKPGAYDGTGTQDFIDRIWPTVEEANKIAPTYARIARSNVIVTDPHKPFLRAPKGSVVRKLTVKAYEDEIEAAYAPEGSVPEPNETPAPQHGGIDEYLLSALMKFVRKHVEEALPGVSISDTDNVFALGLDSLRSAGLSRSLQKGLASRLQSTSGAFVSLRMIYKFPTIEELAGVILSMLFCGEAPDVSIDRDSSAMEAAVKEFTADLPAKRADVPVAAHSKDIKAVIIGPRGSLGPNVVREFLANGQVTKIYCLSRGDDGRERLRQEFQTRSLPCDADDERLAFMSVDLGKARLGLSDQDYDELVNNATVIVHNAWKVDFSWTLELYKSGYLQSVRQLIELSSQSDLRPRIVFISSISSVQEWAAIYPTPVTEDSLPCYEVASPLGYGQSKHVSERILLKAAELSGSPVTILRVGQVAGPTTLAGAAWSTDEWIPSLAAISKALRLVPTDIPPIDWVPVDLAAKAIFELSFAGGEHDEVNGANGATNPSLIVDKQAPRVFNLVNPKLSQWERFADALQLRLGEGARRVPLTEWVSTLVRTDPGTMSKAEASSSTKILPFFQHLAETVAGGIQLQPKFETDKAVAASTTMAEMKAVDEELINLWLEQWGI